MSDIVKAKCLDCELHFAIFTDFLDKEKVMFKGSDHEKRLANWKSGDKKIICPDCGSSNEHKLVQIVKSKFYVFEYIFGNFEPTGRYKEFVQDFLAWADVDEKKPHKTRLILESEAKELMKDQDS